MGGPGLPPGWLPAGRGGSGSGLGGCAVPVDGGGAGRVGGAKPRTSMAEGSLGGGGGLYALGALGIIGLPRERTDGAFLSCELSCQPCGMFL